MRGRLCIRHLGRALAAGVCTVCLLALPTGAATAAGHAARASVPAADEPTGQCTAQTRITDTPPAFDVIQADAAWRITRGAGVTVAVVDSGVAASNPHLRDAVRGGTDLVDDGADAHGHTDQYGHGTVIAGQIAARRLDGSGVVGLAPEAAIMPVRVYADTEESTVKAGDGPDLERLIAGIRYAATHGAQVINVSLSTARPDSRLEAAAAFAAAHGSLVVTSSGNRDQTATIVAGDDDGPRYPAAYAGAIGVAATGDEGTVTDASIHGPHVALAAPGQNILSVTPAGGDCIFSAETPATSYATAYVSAAAALVASAFPDETPAQWAYRLEATARRANPDVRDDRGGWGVVQPYSALTLAPGPGIRGPASPFADAAPPAPAATPTPVTVTQRPPAHAQAWAIGAVVGVLALGCLATAGTLTVLRRRPDDTEPDPTLSGPGLYGDDPPSDTDAASVPDARGAAAGRRQA